MSNELLVSNVVALGPRKTRRGDVVGGRGGWGGDGSPCKGRMGYLLGGGVCAEVQAAGGARLPEGPGERVLGWISGEQEEASEVVSVTNKVGELGAWGGGSRHGTGEEGGEGPTGGGGHRLQGRGEGKIGQQECIKLFRLSGANHGCHCRMAGEGFCGGAFL